MKERFTKLFEFLKAFSDLQFPLVRNIDERLEETFAGAECAIITEQLGTLANVVDFEVLPPLTITLVAYLSVFQGLNELNERSERGARNVAVGAFSFVVFE